MNILISAIKITSVIQYVYDGDTLVKIYTANTVLNSLQEKSFGYSPSSVLEMMEEHRLTKEKAVNMTRPQNVNHLHAPDDLNILHGTFITTCTFTP